MRKIKIIIVLLILGVLSLACSSDFRNSIIERLPEDVSEVINNPGSIATQVFNDLEDITGNDQVDAVEPVHVEDLDYGLSDLESFRFRFVQSFIGEDDAGNEINITVDNDQKVIQPLQITHMRMESFSDVKTLQTYDVYRFGNEVFLLDQKNECTSYTEDLEDQNLLLGLSSVFSNLGIGKMVEQGVIVNGFLADHYEVLSVNMNNSSLYDVEGDIWYAQDGGFILKFYGEAMGEAYSESENINVSGNIRWQYDLVDINLISEIILPEVCKITAVGGVNDIPLPENAEEVSIIGSMLSFNSPDDVNLLVEYYRKEMENLGYILSDETVFEDFFVLTYEKDETTITFMLSGVNTDGSDAIITVEVK